jgi:hypothetical protein
MRCTSKFLMLTTQIRASCQGEGMYLLNEHIVTVLVWFDISSLFKEALLGFLMALSLHSINDKVKSLPAFDPKVDLN